MRAGFFQHLAIFILAVCAGGLPPAARADGPPKLVLVENTDVANGRLTYPLLISAERGYRIRCASQADEEDVIRGLGFLTPPSAVLDPASPEIMAAAPQQNPLLCPNSDAYRIRVFQHNDASGDRFYLQFPEAMGSATYTSRLYVPGCKGLLDALRTNPADVVNADPGPFFAGAIYTIDCKAGEGFPDAPATFAKWCMKADLTAEQAKTVDAMMEATPEGRAGRGVNAACDRAQAFLQALPSLDLSGLGLTDATPLAQLPTLTMLELSGNQLADIGPLQKLVNLRFLDLGQNQLSDVPALGALLSLTELDLSGNRIANLRPLGTLAVLQKLDLSGNLISDIGPLSRLLALTELRLADNQLTGTAIGAISGLSALTLLDLSNNKVETLDHVGGLPSTLAIRLDGNPILAGQITTFEDSCVLRRSEATPFGLTIRAMVEASGKATCQDAADALMSSTTLALGGKGLSDVRPIGLLRQLRSLDLSGNTIVDIAPLAALSELRQLKLGANSIRDVTPAAGLANLDLLDLAGNPFDVSTYLAACVVRDHENALSAEALAQVRALLAASGKANCLASMEQLERMPTLRIADAQLTSVSYFGVLRQARSLDLSGNRIADVGPLASLPNLSRLDLSANQIGALAALAPMERLAALSLARNPLTSLGGIEKLAALSELDISDTGIRSIRELPLLPWLNRANLANLALTYGGIEDYCLARRYDPRVLGAALGFVDAAFAVASAQGVDVADCADMEAWSKSVAVLNLNKRDLGSIEPVRFFPALKELYLAENHLREFGPLGELTRLEALSLAGNGLNAVPNFASNTLRSIDISANVIRNSFGLNNFPSLRSIDVSGNSIADAGSLRLLPNVEWLDLRDNDIQFMTGLAHLDRPNTYISGNPICGFPHESSLVVEACKRSPKLILLDRIDEMAVSPWVILSPPSNFIISNRVGRRFPVVDPNL